CGHFPHGALEFTEEECEGESKGHWYFRQMLGSANITGGRLFHIMCGTLSFQIEHHLFPDIPARRYQQIAPQVREICQRYGIPYNTGRLSRQFGSVIGPPSHPREGVGRADGGLTPKFRHMVGLSLV